MPSEADEKSGFIRTHRADTVPFSAEVKDKHKHLRKALTACSYPKLVFVNTKLELLESLVQDRGEKQRRCDVKCHSVGSSINVASLCFLTQLNRNLHSIKTPHQT